MRCFDNDNSSRFYAFQSTNSKSENNAMSALIFRQTFRLLPGMSARVMSTKGDPGAGAGHGGGSGGSIRDAGGSMGKREAALEEQYVHEQEKEKLQKLKEELEKEKHKK